MTRERPASCGRRAWRSSAGAKVSGVNWDEQLFAILDDLEQQAQALYDADRASELVDRSRSEYAAVTLVSRLMASVPAVRR